MQQSNFCSKTRTTWRYSALPCAGRAKSSSLAQRNEHWVQHSHTFASHASARGPQFTRRSRLPRCTDARTNARTHAHAHIFRSLLYLPFQNALAAYFDSGMTPPDVLDEKATQNYLYAQNVQDNTNMFLPGEHGRARKEERGKKKERRGKTERGKRKAASGTKKRTV